MAITSQPPYVSLSQGMMMEVSSPPEYARTTFLGNGFSLSEQQRVQKGVLHVQAVLRLVINDGARRIDYVLGDFQAAVRRQAVKKDTIRRCLSEKLLIHLISGECNFPLDSFAFLAHAGPNIRVNSLRSRNGLLGRVENFDFAAGFTSDTLRFGNNASIRLVPFGRGDADVCSGTRTNVQERMAHVVAIADVGELQATQIAEAFLKSEEIGQCLTGMKLV